jgi:hypothetical protein
MRGYLVSAAIGCVCATAPVVYPVVRPYVPAPRWQVDSGNSYPAYDDPSKYGGEAYWGVNHAVNPMDFGARYVAVPQVRVVSRTVPVVRYRYRYRDRVVYLHNKPRHEEPPPKKHATRHVIVDDQSVAPRNERYDKTHKGNQ